MQPDFLGIGPPRTGTTTLWACLRLHPDIEISERKELHWFSSPTWTLGQKRSYENNWRTNLVKGEITPTYLEYLDRIVDTYPKIKLILTVRNPVDRFLSSIVLNYKINYKNIYSKEEFKNLVEGHLLGAEYFEAAEYDLRLGNYQKYIDNIDPEKLLVVDSEQLFKNQKETLINVFDFLGVRKFDIIPYQLENYGNWTFDFSQEFLDKLNNFYQNLK